MKRRELLKLGAAAGFAVLTLVPEEARAQGSWSKHNGYKKEDWRKDTRESFAMKGQMGRDPNQGFVVPGSYEWREKRREEQARRRQMRGEFNRFGNGED